MKKSTQTILAKASILALSFLLLAPLLTSVAGFSADKKGNEAKGRFYFRGSCKNCHTKGATGGEVTPLTKTTAQWRAYFTKNVHNKGKESLGQVLGEDKVLDVSTYLVAHAADSLQPETCGK
jgi:mono/diheme cytochrome c family protein